MTPMPGIDPATMAQIQALLKQNPQLLQTLMAGGAGAGALPPGGMGATGPGAQPPPNPLASMPSMSAAPSMATPGMTPGAPAPGGQSQFGPPSGAPQLPPPSGPPPQPPQAAMDPQTRGVNMVLGQAGFGGQERALDRQSQMADELRNTPAPGMLGAGGRVQRAANPLQFLSAGIDRVQGANMRTATNTARDNLFADRMKRLRDDAGLPPEE